MIVTAIRNRTTEIALPYPIRYFRKDSLYMCIASVSELLNGPPPVMM